MKKTVSLFLLVCLIISAFPAIPAAAYEEEGGFLYSITNGCATIYDYVGYDTNCVVPSVIGGCPVTKVKDGGHRGITTLTIPESVEELERFGRCAKTIIIKNGGCCLAGYRNSESLETVIFEDGGRGAGELWDETFKGCENLKTVRLSSRIKNIREGAFSNCYALKAIDIPKSVEHLGKNAFKNCTSLEKVTIRGKIQYKTSMGYFGVSGWFANCRNLKTIEFAEDACLLGSCFSNWTGAETIKIPFGSQGSEANPTEFNLYFDGCSSLKSVSIPYGFDYIPNRIFEGCSSLEEVTIPYSVKTIHRDAFEDCNLTRIKGIMGSEAEQYAKHMGITFQEIEHIYGDLDWNERVEAKDALLALCSAVGTVELISYHSISADVNVDGEVTAADALIILQYSVGLRTVLPVAKG